VQAAGPTEPHGKPIAIDTRPIAPPRRSDLWSRSPTT